MCRRARRRYRSPRAVECEHRFDSTSTVAMATASFKTTGGNLLDCVTGSSQTPRPI